MIRRVKVENGWVRGLPAADPRITGQLFTGDVHFQAALAQADDLHHIMHMGREGMIADHSGKNAL